VTIEPTALCPNCPLTFSITYNGGSDTVVITGGYQLANGVVQVTGSMTTTRRGFMEMAAMAGADGNIEGLGIDPYRDPLELEPLPNIPAGYWNPVPAPQCSTSMECRVTGYTSDGEIEECSPTTHCQ
jgi:hypothetical protein